jgi:hypothetical protein
MSIYNPPICECGQTILPTPGAKSPYIYNKKYCSDGCRATYTPKRSRDETKWETYTCINCENNFKRRKASRNAKIYCSNECAQKHTKIKKHYGVEGLEIVFDSAYETFFWGACRVAKIPVRRFDRTQAVEWKSGQWYAPDFWLPTFDAAAEIKGLQDMYDPERWHQFQQITGKYLLTFDGLDLAKISPGLLRNVIEAQIEQQVGMPSGIAAVVKS